jgi:hypothetical protein
MMTGNMLVAVKGQKFNDSAWVHALLHQFADYYFQALQVYQEIPSHAPGVWQLAHKAASDPEVSALQKILLGVNAHINCDLVLTLVDLLDPEWRMHTQAQREHRYQDHCRVNEIIAETIDAVQDQVLEPAMPVMDLVDRLLGPVDEFLISRLITDWREEVWQNAAGLLIMSNMGTRMHRTREIEIEAQRIGGIMLGISSLTVSEICLLRSLPTNTDSLPIHDSHPKSVSRLERNPCTALLEPLHLHIPNV